MKWFASILVGIVAAPLTAIITGTAADFWSRWLRVSTREGAAGYWVVMIALLAAVVGLVLGIAIARGWLLSAPNFWSALGTTVGVALATTLVLTGIIWLAADLPPKIDGRGLVFEGELRYPADSSATPQPAASPYVTFLRVAAGNSSGAGVLDFSAAREEGGRRVVPFKLDLDTSVAQKMLNIGFSPDPSLYFPLAFGSKPGKKDLEWTDWIFATTSDGIPSLEPDKTFSMRYRIVIEAPPPPPLSSEQQQADADAKKDAEMRALAPDAPLAQWLVFTRYGMPQPTLEAAVAAIRARPNYLAEMAHEMLEGEHDASRDALRVIEHIQPPPAELADAIASAGDQIVQSMLDLEKVSPDADNYSELSGNISTKFSAWMVAVRALQEPKVADFTPQLKAIIEPARRLDKAYAIRVDVLRVTSFYLNKYAGIAPLPGDPPPR